MAEFPRDYQVLLADDGSTDATPEVLAPYTRVLPLTIYRHEERHGYAASVEKLLREAVRRSDYPRRDIVVTLQADFTDEPEEIPTLIRRIEGGADVVTGALELPAAQVPRSVRWTHKLLGYVVRRGRWPDGITDPLSGFRAYRLITLKRALEERNGRPLFQSQGWAANVELLRAVVPYARRVDEAPVEVRYDRRFRETRFRPWETVKGILAILRLAPSTGTAEADTGAGDGDWRELEAGSALTEPAQRSRRRPARQGRGGQRTGRGRRGEGTAQAARGRREGGSTERPEQGEMAQGGAEEARGGARRGRARRPRRPAEEAVGTAAAVEQGPGEGTGEEGEERRRRSRRPRRRPGGGGRGEGADAGVGAVARVRGSEEESGEGDTPRGPRGGRRGGRRGRGGRRTGAGSQGTPGESASSGKTTDT